MLVAINSILEHVKTDLEAIGKSVDTIMSEILEAIHVCEERNWKQNTIEIDAASNNGIDDIRQLQQACQYNAKRVENPYYYALTKLADMADLLEAADKAGGALFLRKSCVRLAGMFK